MERGGSLDGLILKSSLRAAETGDLATHRPVRRQGEARIDETWGLGQSRNGKYLLFWRLGVSVSRLGARRRLIDVERDGVPLLRLMGRSNAGQRDGETGS